MQSCLEQADIAIHFVGEHFGLVPEATELSMVALQNQVAARFCDNRSLKRLIWIPKGLQPKDQRQSSFIRQLQADPRTVTGAELIADTLENLKVLLRTPGRREQAERDKPAKTSDGRCAAGLPDLRSAGRGSGRAHRRLLLFPGHRGQPAGLRGG